LIDRFSFHLGEVVHRIHVAKIWPADHSMAGVPQAQQNTVQGALESTLHSQNNDYSKPSAGKLSSWILVPWTTPTDFPAGVELSSQALIGTSLIGGILGFWRIRPQVYQILSLLQSTVQAAYECRPILCNSHDRYRSLSSPAANTIDGDLMAHFLRLDHALQVQLVAKAIGMDRIVEGWILQTEMDPKEHRFFTSILTPEQIDDPVECLMHPVAQGFCSTTNVICHIIHYLQGIDWHQQ
jgi:hypothetical protein